MSKWISVSERLPDFEVDVLLFNDWETSIGERRQDMKVGYLKQVTYHKEINRTVVTCEWGGDEFIFNITHWMELPNPPKQ